MLSDIYPRDHARFASLPVLGPYLDGFVVWLRKRGYPFLPIRLRIRAAARLDVMLQKRDVRDPGDLSTPDFLAYQPECSQDDIYLNTLIRSLVGYFEEEEILTPPPTTVTDDLLSQYRKELENVRGFAGSTVYHHLAAAGEFLTFLHYDQTSGHRLDIDLAAIEAFLVRVGSRLSRASLQHTVGYLRSFLRFLAVRGLAPAGLDSRIDTPRVYRGERLPRSLPWETVRSLLEAIDRSTPMGRRDYAMLLLVATYGLRTCEVVSLTLDNIDWRKDQFSVARPKVRTPLRLPLTMEVGTAILEYMRRDRPRLPRREVFLRVRAPAGTLKPSAVTEAFQGWVRRSGLPVPFQGPHCLRHSLAVHLLRQGTALKTIGDLLGHRSAESTGIYLRLHVEDLREVALELPKEARS